MLKNLVIWLVIGLVLMTVFNQFSTRQDTRAIPMEYSEFMEAAKQGQISKVELQGGSCWGGRSTDQEPEGPLTVSPPGPAAMTPSPPPAPGTSVVNGMARS